MQKKEWLIESYPKSLQNNINSIKNAFNPDNVDTLWKCKAAFKRLVSNEDVWADLINSTVLSALLSEPSKVQPQLARWLV